MGENARTTQSVRQIRISDQVANYIVQLIAEGRFSPGDALPSETELARRLGVSRPAVREATNTLAGRGLIAITSGRSPTVLPLSRRPFAGLVTHGLATRQVSMVQVLEVRRGLEEIGAELAALNRSDEQAVLLRAHADRLVGVRGDIERFTPIDVAFHRLLAEATGNALLVAMLSGISDVAAQSTEVGLRMANDSDEDWNLILQLHLDIAGAVIGRDPVGARRHMAAHFDAALRRLRGAACPGKEIAIDD